MIIRKYKETDWAYLMQIHDSARMQELEYAGLPDAFVPLEIAAVREGLFDYELYVAEEQGIPVGFTAFAEEELAWLYVSPAHLRQGIGRALVQFVLDHVKTRPMYLEVLCNNTPALALYESMGFETTETVTGQMPGNEAFAVSVHCMKREA